MTHARRLGSMIALACLSPACLLDPMSSGELDRDTAEDATGDDGASAGDAGATSSPAGDDVGPGSSGGDETGGAPAAMEWSEIFPRPGISSVCDVAVDPTGRIAVTWLEHSSPASELERAGLRVFDPSGTDSTAIEATGEVFGSVAFASDGTLRVRGATHMDGDLSVDWARAYDGTLQETWTASYEEKIGWGGCGDGFRGVVVDATDHVVTYNYTCGEAGPCPQSVIRRHAPDGTLLWERNPSGNPGTWRAPLAVGVDGSIFDGAVLTWDDYEEVEVRKHDADGTELWMTLLQGDVRGVWASTDGGAWVHTGSWWTGDEQIARLDASGDLVGTIEVPEVRVIAPASDDSGFFVLGPGDLQRLDVDMQLEWSIPLPYASTRVAAVAEGDERFAFAGDHAGGGDNYWVGALTLP